MLESNTYIFLTVVDLYAFFLRSFLSRTSGWQIFLKKRRSDFEIVGVAQKKLSSEECVVLWDNIFVAVQCDKNIILKKVVNEKSTPGKFKIIIVQHCMFLGGKAPGMQNLSSIETL